MIETVLRRKSWRDLPIGEEGGRDDETPTAVWNTTPPTNEETFRSFEPGQDDGKGRIETVLESCKSWTL